MILKTYQAYTMAEALAAVRSDIGPDAIILHTRAFRRGGFLGIGRRTIVEVTARSPEKRSAAGGPQRPATMKAAAGAASRARIAYGSAPGATPAASGERSAAVSILDRERTRRLAQIMAERHERQRSSASEKELVTAGVAPTSKIATSDGRIDQSVNVPVGSPPVARRFVLNPTEIEAHSRKPVATHTKSTGAVTIAPPRHQSPDEVRGELAAIRDMVGRVLKCQSAATRAAPAMPQQLFDIYLRLVAQDVSDELADQVVCKVRQDIGDDSLDDEQAVREAVVRNLAEFIPAAPACTIERAGGRPYTIALIGPTGVGKTTTLAKLAATIKLKQKKSVGLITCDTYRIAAVDQLRTYANIIGIPLEVVLSADQMVHAMHALRDREAILIDTAGRGQNDSSKLAELREFLDAAQPHETHLVLSSTSSERVLLREAEAFGAMGVDKLVLTKLDEAVSFGVLVNVVQRIGTQLSYLTTGQEVPDHIEPARGSRLADLVLAGEVAL